MNKKVYQNQNYKYLFVAAQALQNRYRQQIFSLLVEKNSMSFNDFLKILKISRSKLAYHLNTLIKNNIITNFYDKREGAKDHSFYELSLLGRRLRMGSLPTAQDTTQAPYIEILEGLEKQKGMEDQEEKEERKDQESEEDSLVSETEAIKSEFSNFRTVRKMEFKSIEKLMLKISKNELSTIDKKRSEYLDPYLNINIKKIIPDTQSRNKVILPSSKLYYNLYKQAFQNVDNILYKH
jgi:hypothetical protein